MICGAAAVMLATGVVSAAVGTRPSVTAQFTHKSEGRGTRFAGAFASHEAERPRTIVLDEIVIVGVTRGGAQPSERLPQ